MLRFFFPIALGFSASLLSAEVVFAAEAAEATVTEQARAHFAAGVAHLEGAEPERYQNAYREFRAAYAASSSWKVLGNLGIAAQKLERFGEAADALSKYLELGRAELTLREAVQVKRDLERLRAEQSTVSVEAGPGPYWIVDTRVVEGGEAVVNQYGPFEGAAELRVRAGQHEVQLERSGQNAPAWSVSLVPGDSAKHEFIAPLEQQEESEPVDVAEDEPPPASAGHGQTGAYLLWGGAAATAIASTVFYLHGDSVQTAADRDFARSCPRGLEPGTGECGLSTTPGDARAANWKSAALFTAAGAVGLAAAGTVLFWLRHGDGEEEGTLEASVGPTGVMLRGVF